MGIGKHRHWVLNGNEGSTKKKYKQEKMLHFYFYCKSRKSLANLQSSWIGLQLLSLYAFLTIKDRMDARKYSISSLSGFGFTNCGLIKKKFKNMIIIYCYEKCTFFFFLQPDSGAVVLITNRPWNILSNICLGNKELLCSLSYRQCSWAKCNLKSRIVF